MRLGRRAELFRSALAIVVGTAIYAFGLHYFVIPNELMEGGVTGISLLLLYALGLPLSVTTLVLNVPLFIIGWKALGRETMAYTILGTLSLSGFLWVMELLIRRGWIEPFTTTQDYFLATLYAGLTLGAGLGIVFRFGGTTGGSDIVARLGQKYRGLSMGQVILAIDAVVIGLSLFYIPRERVLYTLVLVFVASRTIDFITEGAYAAKAFTVITSAGNELAAIITRELERGVTLLPAKGAFSGMDRQMVYCVVSRYEMRRLKAIVRSVDKTAFIVIADVHDVLGEGFRPE